nr:MAG TPA: putative metal-binding protein [Caudoviricetes sp.]DAU13915.1 MAG TPA: putative metal-binding protein [Bacteriophage sp.]
MLLGKNKKQPTVYNPRPWLECLSCGWVDQSGDFIV